MKKSVASTLAVALLLSATAALAAVKTKEIEYKQGDTTLQGYLAWNDSAKGKVPGVLVVHEWWGHNAHARRQAERLAKAGYVGFALDMYGKGKVATHPADAQTFAAESVKDPAAQKARFDAALDLLKQDPHVDSAKIAAIGYCFGGGVVLNMARAGEDLQAVVTFHGALATDHPAENGMIKPRILVNTGDADPFVPADQVAAFETEMKAAGANYQVLHYAGAKHSFTNPDAATYGMEQLAYDADADKKSWAAMLKMFKDVFKS
ncbi:MAG: dienelactone hydrolase family protein [bacterium]